MCTFHVFLHQPTIPLNSSEAPIIIVGIPTENNYVLGQDMLTHQSKKLLLDDVDDK